MQAKGTITIETPRLILRRITLDDADQMFANWASDPEVTKYLTWPTHTDVRVTKNVIKGWVSQYDSDLYFQWVIEHKESKEVIGTISILNIDESLRKGEVGYCLSRRFWNQGIMTEALQYVLNYLITDTDFETIVAKHDINNTASGRVMIKNGLVFRKNQTEFSHRTNQMRNLNIYQLDLGPYRKLKK